jgi:hypothetical protein
MPAKKTQQKTLDPLRLWSQVDETDPAHTRYVNQRGGFTAIDAQWQVLQATQAFGGPMGVGWGFDWTREEGPADLFIIRGRLWFTDPETGEQGAVEQYGASSFGQRVDADAPKKAVTDAFTKCLSLLGFSADVFLGRFDDSKYVAEQNEKHGNGQTPQPPAPRKTTPKKATPKNGAEIIARHANNLSRANAKLNKAQRAQVGQAALERAIVLGLKDADVKDIGAGSIKALELEKVKLLSDVPSEKFDELLGLIQKWEVPF